MKIYDPVFAQRLQRLLQSRGQFEVPLEVPFAGLVITIPGEMLLERAGESGARANSTVLETFASPAAGAEILNLGPSVSSREAWRPLIFRARLVTDATVITRYGDLRITNDPSGTPTTDFYRDGIVNGQAASITRDYVWALGHGAVVENTGNNRIVRPMPDFILLPGQRLTTFTLNLQAGDQWSLVNLVYERTAFS